MHLMKRNVKSKYLTLVQLLSKLNRYKFSTELQIKMCMCRILELPLSPIFSLECDVKENNKPSRVSYKMVIRFPNGKKTKKGQIKHTVERNMA